MSETDPLSGGDTMSTQPAERVTAREIADYELVEVIGRGGMGEIVLARDRRIGRDVALKRLRANNPPPELVDRFLREAKIQARLDHPSIAPVHELGFDSEGLPYFTMKRVGGTTLAELLETGKERPQRLLRALVDVCHAIELAHARRIVHRDLKPTNIMLGDYGEVYVLDWGVARVLSQRVPSVASLDEDVDTIDGMTKAGALLGTPGYMAPEQARGEPVEPAADIYAIGSILFEILTGEPLHPRGRDAIATTIENAERSPAKRRRDRAIAPELDAICASTLATDPAERPTARQLADAIQGYLDGDRDVERRRALARDLSVRARDSYTKGDVEHAMRTAGRALAFDPQSTAAAELVSAVITSEPAEIPRDLRAAVDAEEMRLMRERSRRAVLPYAAIFAVTPLLPLVEVIDWPMLIAVLAAFAMMTLVTWLNAKVGVPIALTLVGHSLTALMFSRLVGPFVITPVMVCAILLSATSIPPLAKRWWAVAAWTLATVTLPFVLEYIGLLAPTWTMTDHGVLSFGTVFDQAQVAPILVIGSHTIALLLVGAYARRIGRDRADAQRKLFLQAWHLGHLLPKTQPSATPR